MRISLIVLLCAFIQSAWAVEDYERQQIQQRIQPVGSVRTEPAASAPAVAPAAQPVAKALSGQEIYDKHCVVCHKTGLAGAPKFRDEADWKPRLTAKKLDGLVASAIKGLNAMPAKGTCSDCSDEDIRKAVEYMLPQP
ncbi:c-type cytochrome [Legionella sp. CNM-4043-24]|uniref:c-type cytochrome n=1 Tax=Legionella sp. CNM-4043-24 TaxID=3421646 RepID=UPI00403B094C